MNTPTSPVNGEDTSVVKGLLMDIAVPDLYQRHPFRLLELHVEASTRDLTRRRQSMEQATRNQLQPPPGPSPLLPRSTPLDEHEVRTAGHELTDARRRLVHELLWFRPMQAGGHASDEPLRAMAAKNLALASRTWTTLTSEAESAERTAAAWHNMASLSLFAALEQAHSGGTAISPKVRDAWRMVWAWWLPLIEESHAVWQHVRLRIKDIDDPSLKGGAAESLRRNLPTALALLQLRHAVVFWESGQRDLTGELLVDLSAVAFPSDFQTALAEARRLVADPLRESLQKQCEAAEKEARADKKQGAVIMENLFDQVLPLLAKLDALLPTGDVSRVSAHDMVALAGLACETSYTNETKDWERGTQLIERCLPIAEGNAARTRLETDLKIDRGNAESSALLKKCWFCGQQDADGAHQISAAMHGDVNTTSEWIPGGTRTRTTWRHITVKVPRCKDCAAVQAKAEAGLIAGLIIFVIGVVLEPVMHFGGRGY